MVSVADVVCGRLCNFKNAAVHYSVAYAVFCSWWEEASPFPVRAELRRQVHFGPQSTLRQTSTKGIMDPEGSRLLTYLLYAYDKPRLCINIRDYAPPRSVLQQAAALLPYTHCAGSILRNMGAFY